MLVRPLSDLDLLPLVIPSEFPTVLSAQSGTSQAASCPLSSHYSLSFLSQPSFSKGLSTLAGLLPHLHLPLQRAASRLPVLRHQTALTKVMIFL